MANKIITKNGTAAPTTAQCDVGELCFDRDAGKLYSKDSGGSIVEIGGGSGGSCGYSGTIVKTSLGTMNPTTNLGTQVRPYSFKSTYYGAVYNPHTGTTVTSSWVFETICQLQSGNADFRHYKLNFYDVENMTSFEYDTHDFGAALMYSTSSSLYHPLYNEANNGFFCFAFQTDDNDPKNFRVYGLRLSDMSLTEFLNFNLNDPNNGGVTTNCGISKINSPGNIEIFVDIRITAGGGTYQHKWGYAVSSDAYTDLGSSTDPSFINGFHDDVTPINDGSGDVYIASSIAGSVGSYYMTSCTYASNRLYYYDVSTDTNTLVVTQGPMGANLKYDEPLGGVYNSDYSDGINNTCYNDHTSKCIKYNTTHIGHILSQVQGSNKYISAGNNRNDNTLDLEVMTLDLT